jgi:hypothetical protein
MKTRSRCSSLEWLSLSSSCLRRSALDKRMRFDEAFNIFVWSDVAGATETESTSAISSRHRSLDHQVPRISAISMKCRRLEEFQKR